MSRQKEIYFARPTPGPECPEEWSVYGPKTPTGYPFICDCNGDDAEARAKMIAKALSVDTLVRRVIEEAA